MRTMWAAGAAIAVSLLLGGVMATAQSPAAGQSPASPPAWTAVTGTSDCGLRTAGSQPSPPPFVLSHQIVTCADASSDPRVTGTSTVDLSIEGWDPAPGYDAVAWTSVTLQGPDGTWTGHGYGIYDDVGVSHLLTFLAGNGAYQGLIYAYSATIPAGTAHMDIVGLIQPGSPPPGFPVASASAPSPAPSK